MCGQGHLAVRIDREEEMFRDSALEDPKAGGRKGGAILRGAREGMASEVRGRPRVRGSDPSEAHASGSGW